jgi:hypothetical protein
MPERHFPVRPNLEQLKHQARDLLRSIREVEASAIEDLRKYHPESIEPASAKLADAQLVLAKSYGIRSWPRLVLACKMTDAIWRDDSEAVRELILKNPALLHEMARGTEKSNWGPPMSYAANLGRDEIIKMLHGLGAKDLESALNRAALQSKIGTARLLHGMLGGKLPPPNALDSPAYTLSESGTAFLFEIGATVRDAHGKRIAPVDVVLETDSRKPSAKHAILEMYVQHGLELPDTPPMAVHRGRIDLLERHLRRDPALLSRTFTFHEIFPPELGCQDDPLPTHGTPLGGATLLHLCADYDEIEIARWLLDHGMNVDAKAAIDADGFGGHTALFATVVSQPNFWMNHNKTTQVAPFTQLLLGRGAAPNAHASLRKQLHPGYGPDTMHEFRDVTPIGWGEQFHRKIFVSEPAMRLVAERGGHL